VSEEPKAPAPSPSQPQRWRAEVSRRGPPVSRRHAACPWSQVGAARAL